MNIDPKTLDPEAVGEILREASYLAHVGIESETFAKHGALLDRIRAESPRPLAQPATRFIFEEDDDGNKTEHQIACTTDAKPTDAAAVLAAAIDDDGRSDWQWMRLRDGTLMLVCFPRGDTYMQFSDAGVCDWVWAAEAPPEPEPEAVPASGNLTVADLLSKLMSVPPTAHVNITLKPWQDTAQDYPVAAVGFDNAVDMLDLFVDLPDNIQLRFNEATTVSES